MVLTPQARLGWAVNDTTLWPRRWKNLAGIFTMVRGPQRSPGLDQAMRYPTSRPSSTAAQPDAPSRRHTPSTSARKSTGADSNGCTATCRACRSTAARFLERPLQQERNVQFAGLAIQRGRADHELIGFGDRRQNSKEMSIVLL